MRRSTGLALGLMAGAAVDAAVGDPRTAHPVAAFGAAADLLEQRIWKDTRGSGAGFAALCVGATVAAGAVVERLTRGRRTYPVVVAAATWTVLGGETLRREARAVHDRLDRRDLPAARERLSHLVGRDTSALDESGVARAVIESVAENTSDAVVAPLFWGVVGGVPGLLGYRAVNTLDAMVGHRSPRYANFGWASARLDDAANFVPSRLTVVLTAALSRRPSDVMRTARRDAPAHPSPNSGWCEAAFAEALEVQLGGTTVYSERVEDRPVLGDGKPADAADIPRAVELATRVARASVHLAALAALVRRRR